MPWRGGPEAALALAETDAEAMTGGTVVPYLYQQWLVMAHGGHSSNNFYVFNSLISYIADSQIDSFDIQCPPTASISSSKGHHRPGL